MMLIKTFISITIVLYYLLAVVECVYPKEIGYPAVTPSSVDPFTRPFQCPYQISEDSRFGVPVEFHGTPGVDLDRVNKEFYAQYKAAIALTPCRTTAIEVFTEDQIPGRDYTVAVSFVYEDSVGAIKDWLKEKYYAESYDNPIRDAVLKLCPNEVQHYYEPYYLRSLDGDQLMNILCEKNCTLGSTGGYGGHYARKKRSYPHISAYYQQPTYPAPTYHQGYPAVDSYQPSYNPSPAYPSDPVPPPPEYYHHPTPPPKPIRFDDAPDPVYGIATRTRRSFSCEGLSERACTLLERTGSLVNCNAARFSECESGWLDCVSETETYLKSDAADFYGNCTTEVDDDDLRAVNDDVCGERRKCVLREEGEVFVGINEECGCDAKPAVDLTEPKLLSGARYKRQHGEVFRTSKRNCRIMRTRNGGKRRACDRSQQIRRRGAYKRAIRIFLRNTNDLGDEEAAAFGL